MEAWRRTLPELDPSLGGGCCPLVLMVQELKAGPQAAGTQTLEEGVLLRERVLGLVLEMWTEPETEIKR